MINAFTTIFVILILTLALFTAFTARSFAPWVPCRSRDLKRIAKLADFRRGDIFYDLGCGTGKTVFYMAKHYNVQAIGLEISLPLLLLCLVKKYLFYQKEKIIFKWKNLFNENLAKADIIYFFGIPKTVNDKLKEKIKKEATPGTKIISYAFKINELHPEKVSKPAENDLSIYLYKIK